MSELDHHLCEEIKKQLKKAGFSYGDVSLAIEVSEVTVKRMLNLQQPLSLERLILIADLVKVPLSVLVSKAEERRNQVPLYSEEQDRLFCQHHELYTLFNHITSNYHGSKALLKAFDLDETSLYLYLRQLEQVGLIEITKGLHYRLLVSRHIAFSESSQFTQVFKNHMIDGLKEKVQSIAKDDPSAYLITAKLRMTEEEFVTYNKKLEALMVETYKNTQMRSQSDPNYQDYTIVDMGSLGSFTPDIKQPSRIKDSTNH